jgi:nicotinamidase-related amidase
LSRDGLHAGGRGLVIVDIQKDYFPGGAHPLVAPEAAARAARRVLDAFPASGDPVVHVRHVWDEEEATALGDGYAAVASSDEITG